MKIKKNREKIEIYKDSAMEFEVNSLFEAAIDLILIPILNSLPKSLRGFVKKSHKSAKGVVENKTTHKALEILYRKGASKGTNKTLKEKIFHKIWFNTNNSKGVRNRLRIVRNEIRKAAKALIEKGEAVNILSIASGSARAVLEAVKDLDVSNSQKISITFLDKSSEALEYSRELAEKLKLPKNFDINWVNDTASGFPKYFDEKKPNIVEMVGLLDYFKDEKVENIFKIIRENIASGGVFITANISYNSEMKFITNLIGWPMEYRTAEDMLDLALSAGFNKDKITAYYEPLKVHSVIVIKN